MTNKATTGVWLWALVAGTAASCGGGLSVRHLQGGALGNLSNRVLSVAMGPRGGLWAGTDNGVARRGGGGVLTWWKSWEITAAKAGAPNVAYFGVSLLTKAVASGKMDHEARLYKGWEKEGQIHELQLGQAFLRDKVLAVHVLRDGRVLAAFRDRGVYVHDKDKDELLPFVTLSDLQAAPTCMAEAPDGTLWVGTHGAGVHAVKGGKVIATYTPKNSHLRGSGVVRSVAVHPTLGLFVATADQLPGKVEGDLAPSRGTGVSQLAGGRWGAMAATPGGLKSNDVSRIVVSPSGAVWFATAAGASILLPGGQWLHPETASPATGDVAAGERHGFVATTNGVTEVSY
jgi:ligand-binding sensor domain-containing protein